MRKWFSLLPSLWLGLAANALAQTSSCPRPTPCTSGLSVSDIQKFAPAGVTINAACEASFIDSVTNQTLNYCEVLGSITTKKSKNDFINFEVSLPDTGWNNKFVFIGNGLFAGQMPQPSENDYTSALADGYAVAGTDTGHSNCNGNADCFLINASWALNNTPAVKDFAYRAVHKTTVAAQAIIAGYYNSTVDFSYFNGCSTGGRQGLVEAEKYPSDFNGIIAGDPAAGNLFAGFNWNQQANLSDLDTTTDTPALDVNAVNLISQTITNNCGETTPGLTTTPLVLNPTTCDFKAQVASLQCPSGQSPPGCLSAAQIATADAILAGPTDTKGNQIYPGYSASDAADTMDGDLGWSSITGCTAFPTPACGTITVGAQEPYGSSSPGPPVVNPPNFIAQGPIQWVAQDGYLRNIVFDDINYAPLTFDFTKQKQINELTTNIARWNADGMEAKHLKKFIKQNHVLLLYHGWSDPVLTPFNTLNLFTNIQSTFGTTVSNNVRLFMVPGMHHCHGGPGPNFIGPGPGVEDPVTVLDLWAREGLAPDGISTSNPIIATHFVQNDLGGTVDRTMPLCSWPE